MFTWRVTGCVQIYVLNLLASIHNSRRVYPTLRCNVIHRFIFQTFRPKVFNSKPILCFCISRLRIKIIKECIRTFSPIMIRRLIGILEIVNLEISINVFNLNLIFDVVFFQLIFQVF
jgi:hypothetical protein